MSIPMTLNLGLSGQPFNGPDLGGFGEKATADLWANWIAVGVYFPFVRAHAQKDLPPKEPWAFGPEVENVARTAIERRYRLLPYYYRLFFESSIDGLPIMRPLFFADPRDPALRSEDQAFLIGTDLLVVPRWAEHPNLPKGIWRTLSFPGENAPDRYQPDIKIRGGAVVPLGRIIQSTAEESLDPLTLEVALNEKGHASGQLYEDAGDGFGYRTGDFLLTTYDAQQQGDQVTVTVTRTEGLRPRPKRKVVVEVVTDAGKWTGAGVDGQPIVVSAGSK